MRKCQVQGCLQRASTDSGLCPTDWPLPWVLGARPHICKGTNGWIGNSDTGRPVWKLRGISLVLRCIFRLAGTQAARSPEASISMQKAILLTGSQWLPPGLGSSCQVERPLALSCTAFLSFIPFKYWLLNFLYWNPKTKDQTKGNGNVSLFPS